MYRQMIGKMREGPWQLCAWTGSQRTRIEGPTLIFSFVTVRLSLLFSFFESRIGEPAKDLCDVHP